MPNSSPPRTPHTPLRRARPGTPAPLHGTLPAAYAAYDRTVPAALALLRRVRPVPLAVLRRALASRPVPAGRDAPRPWPADTRLRRVGAWPWPAGTWSWLRRDGTPSRRVGTPPARPLPPLPRSAPRPPSSPLPALRLAAARRPRDTGSVRTVSATAGAVTAVLAAGTASVVVGRLASDAALKVSAGPLPTEPRLTVHGTDAGRITLTRDLATLRPGVYGLAGDGSHAVVGPVLEDTPHAADTVVRRLERVTHGTLTAGDAAWLTPNLYVGNPRTALGLDHTDVEVPGELGALPAWFVPGDRDTWVIAVHGLGTTREHALNLMGFLHARRLPVLALAYRGDPGAPRPPDRLNHLGETEWRDVEAAIRYAVRHGAGRVVLLGWSTGATMALRAAEHSQVRDRVAGLVLDSPVLSWPATLRALARARRTPEPLLPLAVRAAQGRAGLHADGLAEPGGPDRLQVPTLLVHGPDDRVAPWEYSRRLARRRPGLVTLHTVPDAPHAAMWNADPEEYEERLRRFLTPLL